MKLGVQNPITAGQLVAAYNASTVNDTDWHTLESSDFYDSQTGQQLDSGLTFAYFAMITDGSSLSYIKPRAADSASDPKTNAGGVIPVFGGFDIDSQALSDQVSAISFAKSAGGDVAVIYAGFNR